MLRVNRDHEEGNFNKKKNDFFIRVGSLMLAVSIFSGMFSYYSSWINNLDRVISVSSDVRENMYRHVDGGKYIITKDGTKVYYENKEQDLNITEDRLSKVNMLSIDMTKNNDLSFLKYCDNLEWIIIKNSEMLTDNDLEMLNSLDNIIVSLEMQMKNIVFNKERIDFSKLNNCKVNLELFTSAKSFCGEIGEYILWDFSKSLPSNISCSSQGFSNINSEKCEKIDQRLDDFIATIDFSDTVTEEDKFFKIVEAVISHIKYDEVVAEQAEGAWDKSVYYNEYLLSSVLNDSLETEGVCVNYVALLSAICYKMGIESYYVHAKEPDVKTGHAWNLVKLDGNYKYVDLTIADSIVVYDSVEGVNEGKISLEDFLNKVKSDWVYDFNCQFNDAYELKFDPDEIVSDIERGEVTYCNLELDGVLIDDGSTDKKLPAVIGIGTGLIVGLIYTNKSKRKEKDEAGMSY